MASLGLGWVIKGPWFHRVEAGPNSRLPPWVKTVPCQAWECHVSAQLGVQLTPHLSTHSNSLSLVSPRL